MRSFHYLSVISCASSFFSSQVIASSGVQSSTLGRKRTLTMNYESFLIDRSEDMVISKRDPFTYFQDGQGACGAFNAPSDFIVALNSCEFDGGSHCFQMIEITVDSKTTLAQITDECPGCPCGGLDLSQGLFEFFAPTSVGELSGSWAYNGGDAATTSTPLPSTTTQQSPTTTWTPSTTTSHTSTSTSSTPTTSSTSTTSSTPATTSTPTTTSTPITTSNSTTTSLPTATSSTESPVSTSNPNDPQLLQQINLALIELGSVIQACATMSS